MQLLLYLRSSVQGWARPGPNASPGLVLTLKKMYTAMIGVRNAIWLFVMLKMGDLVTCATEGTLSGGRGRGSSISRQVLINRVFTSQKSALWLTFSELASPVQKVLNHVDVFSGPSLSLLARVYPPPLSLFGCPVWFVA